MKLITDNHKIKAVRVAAHIDSKKKLEIDNNMHSYYLHYQATEEVEDDETKHQIISIGIHNCPKFYTCHAPICPIENNWHKRKHLGGERVCLFLLEASKANANEVFNTPLLVSLYNRINEVMSAIVSMYGDINYKVKRARNSPSRIKPVSKGVVNFGAE